MNEFVRPSALQKVRVQADISTAAIEDVACEMGIDTADLVVYCSRINAVYAMRVARELGCAVVLVPSEIMNDDCWAAHHKDRHEFGMWSEGA
jgi:hypothetical protein